jgi:hypothetical protein
MSQNADDLPGAGDQLDSATASHIHIHKLNEEAASWRVKLREAEVKLAALADAPAKLEAANAEIRTLKVSAALNDVATRLGANPRLTKATLLMDGHLTGLDPDKADFLPALEALVQTAIETDAALKSAAPSTAALRSGGDIVTNRAHEVQPRTPITRDMVSQAKAAGQHELVAQWQRTGQLEPLLRGEL